MNDDDFKDYVETKFQIAKNLAKSGNIKETISILEELVEIKPMSALFIAVLANAYEELEEHDKAETFFRKSVKLKPDFELASLGLFHCLWKQGKTDEAFDEIKRFMAISYSQDYIEIINEINSK